MSNNLVQNEINTIYIKVINYTDEHKWLNKTSLNYIMLWLQQIVVKIQVLNLNWMPRLFAHRNHLYWIPQSMLSMSLLCASKYPPTRPRHLSSYPLPLPVLHWCFFLGGQRIKAWHRLGWQENRQNTLLAHGASFCDTQVSTPKLWCIPCTYKSKRGMPCH